MCSTKLQNPEIVNAMIVVFQIIPVNTSGRLYTKELLNKTNTKQQYRCIICKEPLTSKNWTVGLQRNNVKHCKECRRKQELRRRWGFRRGYQQALQDMKNGTVKKIRIGKGKTA